MTTPTASPVADRQAALVAACKQVSVRYGVGDASVVALDRVDVALGGGETVALWGPSGSGKTTLLHVLGGLVTPTGGVVTWQGAPLPSLEASARASVRGREIAYVFQGARLLPMFSAFENVAFAAHVSQSDDVERVALELLALVGLATKVDHLPAELSGGEAQRVALARALAQRPQLLLCDEPTGQLDSDTTSRVLDLLAALHDRLGFTLVIATHDADVAAGLGRVVELRDGRIVQDER